MQQSEAERPLTAQEIAVALETFDALWALPGTPERLREMDRILHVLQLQRCADALA